MKMIATDCDIPTVRPMSNVIAIVVERPGIAPQSMPRVTPLKQAAQSIGVCAIKSSCSCTCSQTSMPPPYKDSGMMMANP